MVSREEKYSAKLVIDTVVQRCGDVIAAAVFQVLGELGFRSFTSLGFCNSLRCRAYGAVAVAYHDK